MIHAVSDYFQKRDPDAVVFSGAVTSVTKLGESKGKAVYDIVFRPIHWVAGETRAVITVRGTTGSALGTDCEGQFDFLPKVGDEWLMFGQFYEGKVNPDVFLSSRFIDGRLPTELTKELAQNGVVFSP